jgi:taurine--2-oxoglutarate transaminase
MCGFGRTGSWFAYLDEGVTPDLVVFAKGVTSGYVPLGGVVLNEAISCDLQRPGLPGRSHLLRTPPRLRDGGRLHRGDGE